MILQNYRLGFGVIAIAFHLKETNREFEFENQGGEGGMANDHDFS